MRVEFDRLGPAREVNLAGRPAGLRRIAGTHQGSGLDERSPRLRRGRGIAESRAMSAANARPQVVVSGTFVWVVAFVQTVLGLFIFMVIQRTQLWRFPEPQPRPVPAIIDASPSGVTFGAPALPSTFVLPKGFLPSLDARYDDVRLLPVPWLPTNIDITLSRHDLADDVSKMDPPRSASTPAPEYPAGALATRSTAFVPPTARSAFSIQWGTPIRTTRWCFTGGLPCACTRTAITR